jgi:hypothetical protein
MPPLKDFIPDIKDLPLGTISGAAEENVELAVARDIREFEVRMGQAVGTLDIPNLLEAINERHGLVPAEKAADLAANVVRAYDYTTARQPLAISRAGYKSYQAEQLTVGLGQAAREIGATVRAFLLKPQET